MSVIPRILVVTPRYLPEMGGVESHVQQVVRRLRERFFFTVLTTDNGVGLSTTDAVDGVRVTRVPAYPRRRDWRFAPRILGLVSRSGADLVHCQGVHTFVPVLAMLGARRSKLPYVVSFHTGGHSSRTRSRIRDLQWRALRPLLARAARLICVADFEREYFAGVLGLPLDRFVVIPNGGELPEVALPAQADGNRIISVGRLERYKGHHRLIRAMPLVRQQVPDAELVIVGGGPFEAELRQQISRAGLGGVVTITSVPPTERAAMAGLLAHARVFSLLSDYEAHPLAVMEAVALGRPAVVTDTSGLAELADRGLAHKVPLDADDDLVAAALVAQLRNPRPPEVSGAPQTWDATAAAVADVLREVLAAQT